MNAAISKPFTTSTGKTNTFTLVKGDIAQVPADAMITSVNPGGAWWGAIDDLIGTLRKHVAGHVELYPYSMVFSHLNERMTEAKERIALVSAASTFDDFLVKLTDYENEKLMNKLDAVMEEADTFIASLGGEEFLDTLEGLK